MGLWCGIDWAEQHHDVAVVDDAGAVVGRRRIGTGPAGFADLLELLGGLSADPAGEIPVAIETPRGLLPAVLAAVGFTVCLQTGQAYDESKAFPPVDQLAA